MEQPTLATIDDPDEHSKADAAYGTDSADGAGESSPLASAGVALQESEDGSLNQVSAMHGSPCMSS
jgi:hypothetical protein